MRKSAWFLAAALTTFVITILAGVIYTFNGMSFSGMFTSQQAQAAPQGLADQQLIPTQTVSPTAAQTQQVVTISPQDAAAIAAKFLKRTDLYSVQLAPINGINLYKVVFVSGDAVYVSMDGQVVLSVPAPQPTPTMVIAAGPSYQSYTPQNNGGGGGEHEGEGGD